MKVSSEAEMLKLGNDFAHKLKLPAIIELVGDVGAGKTTFTRGLAAGLGVKEPVTSPSFTISKRYAFASDGELVHYDFYRLGDPGIMRAELTETLRSPKSVIVVEWGGGVIDLLPDNHIKIEIISNGDGSREVAITGTNSELWKTCGKPVENSINYVDKTQKSCAKTTENSKNTSKTPNSTQKLAESLQGVKIYLDTSTDNCILRINNREYSRQGRYDPAEKIFTFIHDKLQENHSDWQDITKITFFSGPGSFTGLRIGATIVNTLADQLGIPLYDHHGTKHQIIIPDYGREANISAPKK